MPGLLEPVTLRSARPSSLLTPVGMLVFTVAFAVWGIVESDYRPLFLLPGMTWILIRVALSVRERTELTTEGIRHRGVRTEIHLRWDEIADVVVTDIGRVEVARTGHVRRVRLATGDTDPEKLATLIATQAGVSAHTEAGDPLDIGDSREFAKDYTATYRTLADDAWVLSALPRQAEVLLLRGNVVIQVDYNAEPAERTTAAARAEALARETAAKLEFD